MGRGRRRAGALLAALGLAVGVAGCGGGDEPERRTIGILRSVEGSPAEAAFYDAVGVPRDELTVLGSDRDEIHPEPEDAAAAARRWIGRGAELVLALSTTAATAALEATGDVPVLFLSTDPVGTGLVDDARHPGANATGVSYRVPSDRTLALAEEVFGDLTSVGCLYAADDPASASPLADLRRGAASLGIAVHCASFRDPTEVDEAVAEVAAAGAQVVLVVNSPGVVQAASGIGAALVQAGLPAITTSPADYAVLTLQPDSEGVYRQLAAQARRLLDGTRVADVPVEDPGGFLLRLNLRVAGQLGRTVPEAVVRRADEVVR